MEGRRAGKGRFWIFSWSEVCLWVHLCILNNRTNKPSKPSKSSWSEDQSLLLTHCPPDKSITWIVISSKSRRAHDHSQPGPQSRSRSVSEAKTLRQVTQAQALSNVWTPYPPPQLSRQQVQIIRVAKNKIIFVSKTTFTAPPSELPTNSNQTKRTH